jgi:hypothetical protein
MKFVLSLFLFAQALASLSQNFEVTVLNKDSKPMPYAFILINGKPITVSDTLGFGEIPLNNLKDNDTIGVSYLGAFAPAVIYNQSLRDKNKHSFYLDESGFNLNEVVVTYQDYEKLLRRSIKKIPPLNYDSQMEGRFDAKLKYPGQSVNEASGTFAAANGLRHTSEYLNFSDPPLKIISKSDTTGIGRYLDFYFREVFFLYYQSIGWLNYNGKLIKKRFYCYLGEKDNCKVFRLSYPPGSISDLYVQMIFYVEKKSKYIRSVEIETFTDYANNSNFKVRLKFDCRLIASENQKTNKIYLPDNIYFTSQAINRYQFELNISDITIK